MKAASVGCLPHDLKRIAVRRGADPVHLDDASTSRYTWLVGKAAIRLGRQARGAHTSSSSSDEAPSPPPSPHAVQAPSPAASPPGRPEILRCESPLRSRGVRQLSGSDAQHRHRGFPVV